MSSDRPLLARAPGKVILAGDHAVVYGGPALAAAVNRFASARIETDRNHWLWVASPLGEAGLTGGEEGETLCDAVLDRYQAFLAGRLAVDEVLVSPADFIRMAWLLMRRAYPGVVAPGCRLTVETDLPLGSGMGSSAAVAAAVTAAVAGRAGLELDREALAATASQVEQLQHGRPSGVDVFLAVHGGAVWFRREASPEPEAAVPGPLDLAMTGRPEAGTGECVAAVRAAHGDDRGLWGSFAETAARVRRAVRAGDEPGLIAAVRENHRLLTRIGVVPDPVRRWIATLEEAGGAAKVCGAGSTRGAAGGVVWVVGKAAREAAAGGPYPLWQVEGEAHGVRRIH